MNDKLQKVLASGPAGQLSWHNKPLIQCSKIELIECIINMVPIMQGVQGERLLLHIGRIKVTMLPRAMKAKVADESTASG